MSTAHQDIEAFCRRVAQHYEGVIGTWAYDAFDYINATYFDNTLPVPLIIWGLTPHGGCLGLTHSQGTPDQADRKPPLITLHPSTLGGKQKANPWGVPPDVLGRAYAFDVLLHECIHVSVEYVLGGSKGKGPTSHNNPLWIAEVNRIAPRLGLAITAEQSKPKRIPIEGELTKRGKQPTKVVRMSEGSVPFEAVARFPGAVRLHLGLLDYYRNNEIPEHLR